MSSGPVQVASPPSSTKLEEKSTPAYVVPYVSETSEEIKRLDAMHEGFRDFLEGRLTYAPIEESNPKIIMDLGAGSGAWAIQAATEFPHAQVIGVDLSEIPQRGPPNLKFQSLDLTKPFPFEPESFDIIRSRSVFMHLPNQEEVISRVIQLVKPGGWLLLEDPDFSMRDESGRELGPATKAWFEAYHNTMRARGVETTAPMFERVVKASGLFSEVNVKKVVMPISEQSDDARSNRLGKTLKTSIHYGAMNIAQSGAPGFTLDVARNLDVEFNDRSRKYTMDMIFTWSRKRV